MKRGRRILKFMMLGVIGVLAIGVFGLVTQLLWNWLVPVLFSGPVISFWQAFGLLVLSKILFSGFGKGHHGGPWRGRWRGQYWKEKWGKMTPEEREAFKKKMSERWCPREPDTSTRDSGTSNV